MQLLQEQLKTLSELQVPLTRQSDFNDFWQKAIKKIDQHNVCADMCKVNYPVDNVNVFDTTFCGLDQTLVKCWVLIPKTDNKKKIPAVIWFHGGNGRRGMPYQYMHWLAAGFAVIAMDFRNQGGTTGSNTPLDSYGGNSFSVMNVENYKSYYLYHAWTDALISVKLAKELPDIDEDNIAVAGASQGGGTSLVMAALDNDIKLCLAAVPSYCWWDRRIFIESACASQLARFIELNPDKAETVYNTMSYYDVINFAENIECKVSCTCGMKDTSTPPDCIYAAYNKITSDKSMKTYPTGKHTLEPDTIEHWLRLCRNELL